MSKRKRFLLKYEYPSYVKHELTDDIVFRREHFAHFWNEKERQKFINSFKKYETLGNYRFKIIKKYEEMF